jgi:hypothetical protein
MAMKSIEVSRVEILREETIPLSYEKDFAR